MARRRSRKIRSNKRRASRKRTSRRLRSNSRRRASRRLRSNSKRRSSRRLRSNGKRRSSRGMRRNSRRRASRRLRSNPNYALVSNGRRRASRRLRSNGRRRHSRRMRSNPNYALVSNGRRRASRRMRSNPNYALVSNSRRRASRRLRSNGRRRHSRRGMRRNSAAVRAAIGRGFAQRHQAPLAGRIKRIFDKPSQITYYGAPAYRKSFGKLKSADAKRYAKRLGALVANTLVGGLTSKYASHKVGHPSQVVETRQGSRMWNASYPITVSAYQTTGYIRDFKFGGIAKRKANAAKGTRFTGGRKRKHSRNVA